MMQYWAESLSRSSSSLISLFWMNVKSRMEAQSRHSSDGERPAGHKRVSQNVLKNQQWFPCCPSPVTPAIGCPTKTGLLSLSTRITASTSSPKRSLPFSKAEYVDASNPRAAERRTPAIALQPECKIVEHIRDVSAPCEKDHRPA